MAFLAALVAFGSRFATKVLTTALGWASTLLFGRVPGSRQIMLLGITFGSVIWIVMLIGLIVPDVGTFLLLLIPSQDYVPQSVIRLLMLAGVIIAPGVVGGMTLLLETDKKRTARGVIEAIARGYPLTLLLSVLLVFLALLAIWRKATSLVRRWNDAHVPMVVDPGAYEQVAHDLDEALSASGLDLAAGDAPASMSTPAKWLTAVAGRGSSSLVPDRMVRLRGPNLDILIYPMDVLISGKSRDVVRARAAIASRLTTAAAHLTVSAEAQGIEDRLRALAIGKPGGEQPPPFDEAVAAEFKAIDGDLARIEVPYEEWEVLYRQRLQVERDLRAGAMAGEALLGTDTPEPTAASTIASVTRMLRRGAAAVLEAATDDETIQALDKLVGPRWRLAAAVTDAAVDGARAAVEEDAGPSQREHDLRARERTGEPIP
jgi:hypothetical protein